MNFRITRHSGHKPPANALDLLWQRLGPNRDGASFAKLEAEIRATVGIDAPVSMTQDERAEVGRREVLGIVRNVCEQAQELELDWFAVSSSAR